MAAHARMKRSSSPKAGPLRQVPVAGPALELLLWIGFGIAILAVAIVVWAAYRINDDNVQGARWVSQSELVIQSIDQAREQQQNALEAVDTYWRDGDPMLFNQFQIASVKLREDLDQPLGAW